MTAVNNHALQKLWAMGSSGRTSGGGSKEQQILDRVEFVWDMRGDVNISGDKKDQVCEGIRESGVMRHFFMPRNR